MGEWYNHCATDTCEVRSTSTHCQGRRTQGATIVAFALEIDFYSNTIICLVFWEYLEAL